MLPVVCIAPPAAHLAVLPFLPYRRQVGGFTMMHREDLRRVAPYWIKYSEDVRADRLASRKHSCSICV